MKPLVVFRAAALAGVVVAGIVIAGVGGCGGDRSTDHAAGAPDGRALFEHWCATCHGPDGRPSGAMAARLGVRDLTASEFRARVTPALVEQQVRTGSKNKLMPSFEGALDDAQIKAVAAFVAAQLGAQRPDPGAAQAGSAGAGSAAAPR